MRHFYRFMKPVSGDLWSAGLVVAAFFSMLLFQIEGIANDPGLGWHLKTGELVVTSGIPKIDPFLGGRIPQAWVADQWLSDVMFWTAWLHGGWGVLGWVTLFVYSVSFLLVMPATLTMRGIPPVLAMVVAWVVWKLSLFHYIVRPVVVSFLAFSSLLLFLAWLSRKEGIALFWLFPLALFFWLWSALHPSFVFGWVVIGAHLIQQGVHLVQRRPHQSGWWLLACGAVAAAPLCGPYGVALIEQMVALGGSDYFMHLHEEWQSPNLRELPSQLAAGMAAVIVLGSLLLRRVPSMAEGVMLIVFAFAGARAVRCLPYFGMVAAFPVAATLQALIVRYSSVHGPLRAVFLTSKGSYGGAVVVFLCLMMALGNVLAGETGLTKAVVQGPSPHQFPYQELAVATSLPGAGDRARPVIAPPAWGGFVTLMSDGTLYPLLDDRNTLVGEQLYEEFTRSFRPQGDWRSFTRRYGGCLVLAPLSMDLGRECVKQGSDCAVVATGRVAHLLDVC